ncbi:MAG: hypothetical protein JNK82_07775 [Myxococcaceae bacterium]|nr:hypothetical protein [Myxococcaceae bacterium]
MRHAVVITVLFAAACNCGGPTTARDLYVAQYAELCALYARCGFIGRSEADTCESRALSYYDNYLGVVTSYDIEASVQAGKVKIDGSAVNRCLGVMRSMSCSAFGSGGIYQYLTACASVYRGGVAPGGACANSLECSSGACQSSLSGNMCVGVCVAYAAEGQSCAPGVCDPTRSFCDTTARVCRPRGIAGAPCTPTSFGSAECADGLGCTAAGVCARPGAGGEACASSGCQKGFHCVNNICAADVRHGESCADAYACPDGDRCIGLGPGTSGVCTSVLDVSAACDSARDACPTSAPCSVSTRLCTPPVPVTEGSSCQSTSCTQSTTFLFGGEPLYCDRSSNTCKKKVRPGAACTRQSTGEDPCLTSCSATTGSGTCNAPAVTCL